MRNQSSERIESCMVQISFAVAAFEKAILPLFREDSESFLADPRVSVELTKQNLAVEDFTQNIGLFLKLVRGHLEPILLG